MADQERLDAIRARLEAATLGPWHRMARSADDTVGGLVVLAPDGKGVGAAWSDDRPECMDNAALIAHAPEDLRWLLDRLAVSSRVSEEQATKALAMALMDGFAAKGISTIGAAAAIISERDALADQVGALRELTDDEVDTFMLALCDTIAERRETAIIGYTPDEVRDALRAALAATRREPA